MLPKEKRRVETPSKSSEIKDKEPIEFDYQPMDYGVWLARGTGYGSARRPTKTIAALRNLKGKRKKAQSNKPRP